jgi:hypothetical protein
MLTYSARPRGLYKEPINAEIEFPCIVNLAFKFEPGRTFGGEGSLGRTVPLGAKARLGMDFCRGETTVDSDMFLEPIEVELKLNDGVIVFEGATMRITFEAESREALESVLETYYYCIPALLSIDLIDTPIVTEVQGTAGGVSFCWGILDSSPHKVDVVTKQIQEERIITAFNRLKLFDENKTLQNLRLLAATQYFYLACRLNRTTTKLWEFLSESILNEAKILETLFPAPPEKTIDYARFGLKSLGFSDLEIEALFIPALALRNSIDIGHPMLTVLSTGDAKILYRYTDQAEDAFRTLLQRVFQGVETGAFIPQPVENVSPSSETRRVIRRIAENLAEYENKSRVS